MNHQGSCVSVDHCDRDPYASSHTRKCVLEASIVRAGIGESFGEYLEICDVFCAAEIEA
jgi:hypothetical protein